MSERELRTSIHNRFDIEVRDAETGKLKQKAEAFNVICNGLWDILLNHDANNKWLPGSTAYNQRIVFGTGIGTPSSSDTALFNYLGYKAGTVSFDGTHFLENLFIATRTIVLNPDEYVGEDLTEVGIGTQSVLATHALIKDLNGNTISIHKTATDIITIISSIYVHFARYLNDSIMFDYDAIVDPDTGILRYQDNYNNYNMFFRCICGLCNIDSFALSSISSKVCSGDSYHPSSDYFPATIGNSSQIVDYANKKITVNCGRLEADIANSIVHRVYRFTTRYWLDATYRYHPLLFILVKNWYTPALITQESIGTGDGTTTGFNTSFPIKTVDKIYIDGVQETNYSFCSGPLKPCLLLQYMPRVKKHDNILYYVTSSYEKVDANGYITYGFQAPLEETLIYEYPFYLSTGIKELNVSIPNDSLAPSSGVIKLLGCNDLETWIESSDISIFNGQTTTFSLPSELKNKKYYKIKAISYVRSVDWRAYSYLPASYQFVADYSDSEHNVVFQNPPNTGSVITIDYTPDCVAKDENHVFDLSFSISFNESQVV